MSLEKLPNELILPIALLTNDLEAFASLASTCRRLRHVLDQTPPRHILQLAAGSAPTFFSPHPYFLVALTAREASDWALGDEGRTEQLREAMRGGIDSLYGFCLEHSGLTMERIRSAHLARFHTLNPLVDKIDKMAGAQWYKLPNFWSGGVSDAGTYHAEPERNALEIITYGELFGRSMDAFLQPERALTYFDVSVRIEYLKHCVHEWADTLHREGQPTVVNAGSTAWISEDPAATYGQDQLVLYHILHCGKWRRMWGEAIRGFQRPGEVFRYERTHAQMWNGPGDLWREGLTLDAFVVGGLDGMQVVTRKMEDVDKSVVSRLKEVMQQIEGLQRPPPSTVVKGYISPEDDVTVSHAPDPCHELMKVTEES